MIDKQKQDCWNCARITEVVQSKLPCPYRPRTNMPVYCDNWVEQKQSTTKDVATERVNVYQRQ